VDRWDAAKAIVTACADDVLTFVRTSDPTCPAASTRDRRYPTTVLDHASGRFIADSGTLSINWGGRTCYLGFTLPFQLFEALARRPNRYIPVEELLDEVWTQVRSDAAVRSVVRDLRARLREAGMADLAEAIDGSNHGRDGLMLESD
jgi:DNA-binding response OmpR family regulator